MDWSAFRLSALLAILTVVVLLPVGATLARALAYSRLRGKAVLEAALALPLVLPPTVLGYYLLVVMGSRSTLGGAYEQLTGHPLAFSFEGLLIASVLFNLPFAIIPMQRAFESISLDVRQAAKTCGMGAMRTFFAVELPLAAPGILSGLVLTAAHTLGEFGVVLMVGGSIPGETKTIAIAIYDRVQAFDMHSAGVMSAVLLLTSLVALTVTSRLGRSGSTF